MRRRRIMLVPLALLLLLPATPAALGGAKSSQAEFIPDRVRLLAIFRNRDLGEKAYLSGQFRHLDGPDAEIEPYQDHKLVLEEAAHPFTTWTAVQETTTDQEGYYFFTRKPTVNTRYRVRSLEPSVVSEEPLVRVRLDAELEIEDKRVREGRLVRFSGSVQPPHDALSVIIQRKEEDDGGWRTVKRTRLVLNEDGTSTFERRVRVNSPGRFLYRVRVSGDGDHLPGESRAQRLVVVEKPDRRSR